MKTLSTEELKALKPEGFAKLLAKAKEIGLSYNGKPVLLVKAGSIAGADCITATFLLRASKKELAWQLRAKKRRTMPAYNVTVGKKERTIGYVTLA